MPVFVEAGVFVAALVSLFSALGNGIVFDAFSFVRFLPVRGKSFGICGWRNDGFLFGWWYAHWQNVFTDRVNKTP